MTAIIRVYSRCINDLSGQFKESVQGVQLYPIMKMAYKIFYKKEDSEI